MARPETSLNKFLEESRRAVEANTLHQKDRDIEFLSPKVKEQADRIGATIHMLPVSTERDPQGTQSSGVHEFDGDILDPEFRGGGPDIVDERVLNLRCEVQHDPPQQLLNLYGIDEQREVVFWIPFKTLKEKGLVTEWRIHGADIGDLFFWDETWYQGWNVYRETYHGQTAKAHHIACFCNRYRHNAVPTEDTPNDCTVEELYDEDF